MAWPPRSFAAIFESSGVARVISRFGSRLEIIKLNRATKGLTMMILACGGGCGISTAGVIGILCVMALYVIFGVGLCLTPFLAIYMLLPDSVKHRVDATASE